jgi:hypothetical protein
MRPIYEKDSDRDREAESIAVLASSTGSVPIRMAPLSGWDYEMRKGGKLVALVEVKCRSCLSTTYRTYLISEAKVRLLREAAIDRGVAGLLLVRWLDGHAWLSLTACDPSGWHVEIGGRVDRGDPRDLEKVVHFPISDFRFLNGGKP